MQQLFLKAAAIPQVGEHDAIVTNLRHYEEALVKALEAVRRVKKEQDIRKCIFYLGEITGQIITDEILFSKFCVGK